MTCHCPSCQQPNIRTAKLCLRCATPLYPEDFAGTLAQPNLKQVVHMPFGFVKTPRLCVDVFSEGGSHKSKPTWLNLSKLFYQRPRTAHKVGYLVFSMLVLLIVGYVLSSQHKHLDLPDVTINSSSTGYFESAPATASKGSATGGF